MIIPFEKLDAAVLRSIVEDFITRDGTDYGEIEHSLAQKVDSLLLQIKRSEVFVTFDEASESVSLVTAGDALQKGLIT